MTMTAALLCFAGTDPGMLRDVARRATAELQESLDALVSSTDAGREVTVTMRVRSDGRGGCEVIPSKDWVHVHQDDRHVILTHVDERVTVDAADVGGRGNGETVGEVRYNLDSREWEFVEAGE